MVRVKPQTAAAHQARPKAWLPAPSDQCVQRRFQGRADCVEKRDSHRGGPPNVLNTKRLKENSTLDKRARSEKRPLASGGFPGSLYPRMDEGGRDGVL